MLATLRTAFSRISIRWKIVAVLALLISIGFCVAGVGMTLDYRSSFRRTVQNNVDILAEVVGNNCRAALVFNDPEAARETLEALSANVHILDAVLFDAAGDEFSAYSRGEDAGDAGTTGSDADTLTVRSEIRLDGQSIGSLQIRSDLREWRNSLSRYVRVAMILFLSVILLTILASAVLQRLITDSLRELVATMRRISVSNDFSLRAKRHSEDEVGELVEAFNAMLCEIEHRDVELALHVQKLGDSNLALQREVQEREQAERELEINAVALERSNQELEQFAYATSHDLQEPLRGIASSLQLLEKKQGDRLDEEAKTLIGFAVDGSNRLKRLINGLLAYSRVNTRNPDFGRVDCEAVRKQVLGDLAIAITEARATITSDPLPVIEADAMQLPLVFQNLISNALRFRTEEDPRIHVGAERKDGEWLFSVADNGIGIEPRFYDRIFEIFQRLHGREQYDGTGIGLAVTKKVVERHRGRIWIESTGHHGTKFCFTVPDGGGGGDE